MVTTMVKDYNPTLLLLLQRVTSDQEISLYIVTMRSMKMAMTIHHYIVSTNFFLTHYQQLLPRVRMAPRSIIFL